MSKEIQHIQSEIQTGHQQVPIAAMFQAVIEKGVTAENAAAIEKLCDLHLKLEAISARKSYARAMAAMQAELPPIIKSNPVYGKANDFGHAKLLYSYAKYEEMMQVIQPFLTKYGFSITCGQQANEKQIITLLTIAHEDGHSEIREFSVRHSSGTSAMSTAQVDASDSNLARRHALARALNLRIVGEEDDDARLVGETITAEQAADLRKRLKATGRDEARFLKFAGAATFEEIRSAKLPELNRALETADRAARSSAKLNNSLDRAEHTADKLQEKFKQPPPISDEEGERIRQQEIIEAGKHRHAAV